MLIKNNGNLYPTPGYSHVNIVSGQRMVYFAGQMPVDETGYRVVGEGDLDAQVDRTVLNALAALELAGVQPDDVVRTVVYVASADEEELGRVWLRLRDSKLGAAFTSASTLLGVTKLGIANQLVEVDMTAVLDE